MTDLTLLEKTLEEQVTLGVASIFSGVMSTKSEKTLSFHHTLSRLTAYLMVPITYVLFHKTGKDNYKVIYISNNNEIDRAQIIKNEIYLSFLKKKSNNKNEIVFPIFNSQSTGFFLGALRIKKDEKGLKYVWLPKISKVSQIYDYDSLLGYKLKEVLNEKRYRKYGRVFKKNVKSALSRFEEIKVDTNFREKKTHIPNTFWEQSKLCDEVSGQIIQSDYYQFLRDEIFRRNLLENNLGFSVFGEGLEARSVVGKVFKKAKQNDDVLSSKEYDQIKGDSELTNFFLILSTHPFQSYKRANEQDKVTSGFNYEIFVALCDEQKNQIEKYLYSLCIELKRGKNHSSLLDNMDDSIKQGSFNTLIKIFDNGHLDSLIQLMRLPYSKSTRSILDTPYSNFISTISYPFNDRTGGAYRCGLETSQIKKRLRRFNDCLFRDEVLSSFDDLVARIESEQFSKNSIDPITLQYADFLRSFVFNLLFWQMSNTSENKITEESSLTSLAYLQCLNIPIEVAGVVYGGFAFISHSYNYDRRFSNINNEAINSESENNDIKIFHSNFMRNYFAFNHINQRIKKNLRMLLKQQYIADVTLTYKMWYINIFERLKRMEQSNSNRIKKVSIPDELISLNKRLLMLSTMYPYPSIKLVLSNARLNKDMGYPPYLKFKNKSEKHDYSSIAWFSNNYLLEVEYDKSGSPFKNLPSYTEALKNVDKHFVSLTDIAIEITKTSLILGSIDINHMESH